MSTEMTRDDLLTLMRAWGWTLTGSLANGRADLWSHPGGMDEVIVPGAGTAPDYDRMLRQAESIIARAEGPRLLAVVREVAALHQPRTDEGPWGGYCTTCSGREWPCPTARAVQALTETTEETTVTSDCVFCQIIWGTAPGKIVREWSDAIALIPLTPVVDGHVLIIPKHHVAHAATDPSITARTMGRAAEHATRHDSFNLITSAGRAATQSIDHLHIHVIPRVPDDQLMTPWGTVYGDDPTAPHWCRQAQELSDRLNGMT